MINQRVTWDELVKVEPRLKSLLERCEQSQGGERAWYQEFKPVLCRLIGFERREDGLEVLFTNEAYDVAYRHLIEALHA